MGQAYADDHPSRPGGSRKPPRCLRCDRQVEERLTMAARQWLFFDFDDVLAHRSLDRSKLVGERLGILPEQARAFYADGYKDIARFAKQAWAIRTVADEVDFYTELFTHLGGLSGRHHSHQSLADLAVEFVAVPLSSTMG